MSKNAFSVDLGTYFISIVILDYGIQDEKYAIHNWITLTVMMKMDMTENLFLKKGITVKISNLDVFMMQPTPTQDTF